jgi:hypothetical protein
VENSSSGESTDLGMRVEVTEGMHVRLPLQT